MILDDLRDSRPLGLPTLTAHRGALRWSQLPVKMFNLCEPSLQLESFTEHHLRANGFARGFSKLRCHVTIAGFLGKLEFAKRLKVAHKQSFLNVQRRC